MNQMKISNLFKYHAQGALKIHFVQNGSLAIFNSQHDLEKAIKTETHADLIFHFCDGSKLVFIGIQKNFINWKLINALDDFLLYVALVSAMGLNLYTGSKAYDVVCRQFCEYPDAFIKMTYIKILKISNHKQMCVSVCTWQK